MSSGSSGKRVTLPEPSRSMFCFMSRMLGGRDFILCCLRGMGVVEIVSHHPAVLAWNVFSLVRVPHEAVT
jgi:hypothetical protein